MITPELLATRGDAFIAKTRGGTSQRTIIGRVVSDEPILRVLVNDRDVSLNEKGIFQEAVVLRGNETDVAIEAVDQSGRRSDLRFILSRDEEDATRFLAGANEQSSVIGSTSVPSINYGTYYALLIGNTDYQQMPNLSTAVNDVEEVDRVLREKYGFQTKVLRNATRYEILDAIETARKWVTELDNFVIYYAGHGEVDSTNNKGNWLPVDAEPGSRANWIASTTLSDLIKSYSAKHVLVVADSCYSGLMTRSTLSRLDEGRSDEAYARWIAGLAETQTRMLLSSGADAPVLDNGGGKHSIFAKAFLDVLRLNQGVLEGKDLHREVAARVTYAAEAAQFDQEPQYSPIQFTDHEGGDFLFVRQE
jgi:uncharacterized caspase-like protein